MYELMYLALAMVLWAGAPHDNPVSLDSNVSQPEQTAQETATMKGFSVRKDRSFGPKASGVRTESGRRRK